MIYYLLLDGICLSYSGYSLFVSHAVITSEKTQIFMVKSYENQGLIYTLIEKFLMMFGVKYCISLQRNATKSCIPFFATKEHVTTL